LHVRVRRTACTTGTWGTWCRSVARRLALPAAIVASGGGRVGMPRQRHAPSQGPLPHRAHPQSPSDADRGGNRRWPVPITDAVVRSTERVVRAGAAVHLAWHPESDHAPAWGIASPSNPG